MGDRRLRQRCARLVRGLDVPVPFDADILLQKANPWAGEARWEVPADAAPALGRINRALGPAE